MTQQDHTKKIIPFTESQKSAISSTNEGSSIPHPTNSVLRKYTTVKSISVLFILLCLGWGYRISKDCLIRKAQKQFTQLETQEQKASFAKAFARTELGGIVNLELAAEKLKEGQLEAAQGYYQQAYKCLRKTFLGKSILLTKYSLEANPLIATDLLSKMKDNRANSFFLQQQINAALECFEQRKANSL